jgi:hypothetical protein
MHQKGNSITVRFLLTLSLGAASFAFAQPGAPNLTPNVADLRTYLTLTDAQVTSLQNLRTQQMTATQADQTEIRTKQTQLQQLLTAGTTAQAAGQILLDIEAIRRRLNDAATRYNTQALAVLTAAQRTQLATLTTAASLDDEIQQATLLNLILNQRGAGVGPGPGFGGRGFRMPPPFER